MALNPRTSREAELSGGLSSQQWDDYREMGPMAQRSLAFMAALPEPNLEQLPSEQVCDPGALALGRVGTKVLPLLLWPQGPGSVGYTLQSFTYRIS